MIPRSVLAAGLIALALAPAAAHARDDASLNASLLASGKWTNEPYHAAKYDRMMAEEGLTDAQRARVLNYRANERGAAGDKLGQLADLDRLVAEFPDVPVADRYAEGRSYAYVQAWHLSNRALDMLNGKGAGTRDAGNLRDLWELGYWDDVASLAIADGKVTLIGNDAARNLLQKLAASGRGTAAMCEAYAKNKAPCEMGPFEPSPQPKAGAGLAAALAALRLRAAPFKTD